MMTIAAASFLGLGSTIWYMIRWELDNMTSPPRC